MKKNYIKLNNNDNHLSLGNLFRITKELSVNKSSAMQVELFCILFDVENVYDTTVNNYCVGCRTIGNEYKQKYLNLKKQYHKNEHILDNIILNYIFAINGEIETPSEIYDYLTKSKTLNLLVNKLINLAKNDKQVNQSFIDQLNVYIKNNQTIKCFIEILFFIILEKIQPIYESELKLEVFENVLEDTSISSNELKDYLSLKLNEGINFDYSMKKLAREGNSYACFELGLAEMAGAIMGEYRYDKAYDYFYQASLHNHSGANNMIGYMLAKGYIGNRSMDDIKLASDYLNKAISAGNIAANNTLGNLYYEGIPPFKKNVKKAMEYYQKAASKNYAFAFNNIGKIIELKDSNKAMEYYKKSADLGESWACNKVGEYYRKHGNYEQAYNYYMLGTDSNKRTICYYNYYNLAKYFYLNGCGTLIKVPNYEVAKKYFYESISLIESATELFYILIKEYLVNHKDEIYNEILRIKTVIENHPKCSKQLVDTINLEINNIKKRYTINLDI